jgi:hypothetical protein
MRNRRDSFQVRGWRTLGWAVATFFAVHLIGGLLLDYCWPHLRFPSADSTLKALARQPRSPDVICLGSSRFGAGFVQEEVRQRLQEASADSQVIVFNAAIEAGDLITAEYVLEEALKQGVRPRLIVVEISPETLARRSEWMGQHVLRQLTWSELPEHAEAIWLSGNLVRAVSARLLPLHVHRHQIGLQIRDGIARWLASLERSHDPARKRSAKRKKQSPAAPDHGVPWEVFQELASDRHDPARIEAGLPAIRRWLKNYQPGGSAARSLENLLTLAQDHGAEVILVGVPVAEAHRRLYTDEIETAFLDHVRSVCDRRGCLFVDYRHRIPDPLFQDNHHLTRAGGSLFSRLLTEEVLLPTWRQRQAVTLGESGSSPADPGKLR